MDRTQTWWYNAGAAWFTYVARGSQLLRQGVPVSDLLVFIGDGAPNSTVGRNDFPTPIPNGIHFDCVNADVLSNRISVNKGQMQLPEGTTYKALVIKNSNQIRLQTLRSIYNIAKQGVPIIGDQPKELLGYKHSQSDLEEFNKLVAFIWNRKTTSQGYNWEEVLTKNAIVKDFSIEGRTDIEFMHRKKDDTDIYFTYNPDAKPQTFHYTINNTGKIPELWNPMDGSTIKSAQFTQRKGYTALSVSLKSEESVFIVFRDAVKNCVSIQPESVQKEVNYQLNSNNQIVATVSANGKYKAFFNGGNPLYFEVKDVPAPVELTGSWKVKFDKKQGFGSEVEFKTLSDWKDHPNDSIKYYSGTATYTKSFQIAKKEITNGNLITLDLGKVSIVARVKLNGSFIYNSLA
jgi:uncharacterized protein GlcG (DUF336 family)